RSDAGAWEGGFSGSRSVRFRNREMIPDPFLITAQAACRAPRGGLGALPIPVHSGPGPSGQSQTRTALAYRPLPTIVPAARDTAVMAQRLAGRCSRSRDEDACDAILAADDDPIAIAAERRTDEGLPVWDRLADGPARGDVAQAGGRLGLIDQDRRSALASVRL